MPAPSDVPETINPEKRPAEPRGLDRRRLLQTGAAAVALTEASSLLNMAAVAGPQDADAAYPAMRGPERPPPSLAAIKAGGLTPKAPPPKPPLRVIAFNRMGFGQKPGDFAAYQNLGSDDDERFAAYVEQQLFPANIVDTQAENRMAAAGFESIGITNDAEHYRAVLWDWYINNNAPSGNTSSSVPHDELMLSAFVRAIYSKKQLAELMVDFWHNHFNVYIDHSSFVRATLPHLDLVIRQHVMGNFRLMLEDVARSTAMLYYLDNYTNSAGGPNENFSRELFELHTLGAENYLGILPQSEVPTGPGGWPIGYVDADVFEATRCFTGWSFSLGIENDGDTGHFYYRPDWHDRFQKHVLGVFIPSDQPDLEDGRNVLNALSAHPGTGRHIARKLCRRLVADDPPQRLVDEAAQVFTDNWQYPTQLRRVYRTILRSPEFRDTWGEKTKRPFEIAASSMRACGADIILRREDNDSKSFLRRYDDTGQELFHWPPPNGYPDVRGAWMRMGPRLQSWKLCNWLIDFHNSQDRYYLDVVGQTPAGVRSANGLADHWITRILGRPMAAEDREEIVQFMAQGINPDLDLDLGDDDTADRLRAMAGLILMSPDFLWR